MATTLPSSRREAFGQWWQLRSRSERMLLATALGVLAVAAAWLVVWQPLARDMDRLSRQIETDRATLADARRRVDEIAGLARSTPSVAVVDPRAALDPVLVQRNLKTAVTTIERIDNERIRLTFDTIGFDALTVFLDSLQRDARLRPVELVATARVEPGQVRADLTLAR
ncbi:MAG TPA: type II secretion system protein GspM [Casimicrobiaceae bacterium]|nr:type II secretion system protein GspM [Casimicrobiaceae bacterium]